jgi:GNAT superfamily N-acetyltransferase
MPPSNDSTSQPTTIERLSAGNGQRVRAIRLRALADSPDAFATTFEEAAARPLESWDRQLDQIATFVATAGGGALGLVRGTRHDTLKHTGYLISLWVAPEARGHGIGASLVAAVVRWAKTQGFQRLLLDVGETNAPAIALYTRTGFAPNGKTSTLPPPREHIREIQLEHELRLDPQTRRRESQP